jgi:hypothetical protein
VTPALLKEVIEAHGGARRWSRVAEISAHVRSGGLLMRSKLKRRQFADYGLSIATDRPSAVLQPYPRHGFTGVFERGSVRILDQAGGVTAERDHAREAFFGIGGLGRNARWSDLDALYFAGYAMWNYLNLPFLLAGEGFESKEAEPIEVRGERWRRLDVSFPEELDTHCREQSLYFDDAGLLRGHDYSPDVISPRARARHLSWEHREFGGIVFPTKRRVVPLAPGGRALPGPTIVSIELASINVT